LLDPGPPADIGGKARGLLALHRLGAPVPPWVVIPAGHAAEAPWRAPEHLAVLERLFKQWRSAGFSGLAVRSSALVEDGRAESHAGRFETVFAARPEEISDALDRVLASAGDASPMAIVLQAGIRPTLAGVVFSAHPAEADPALAYAEIVQGHGEALVGGDAAPTRLWLNLPNGTVAACEPGEGGPPDCDAALAADLAQWLLRIEEAIDAPADAEWAHDGAQLWLLQARPITAMRLSRAQNPRVCATSWFFDQRFSQPISPLTRSTLVEVIARVGVEEALAIRGAASPAPLLYDYGGQAYVAHEAFCRAFGGAPRWLLTQDLRQLFPEQCHCAGAAHNEAFRYLWMTLKALLSHGGDALLNLPRWARFREAVTAEVAAMEGVSAEDRMAWRQQWEALDRLNERFLRLHRWSILWADYGYRIFSWLKRCVPQRIATAWDDKLRREISLPTAAANAALEAYLQDPDDALARSVLAGQYGHRSASLDYASPTWVELLEDNLLAQQYDYASAGSGNGTMPCPPRGMLSVLLWPLRRSLEMREEQRFTWERILARQRQLLRDAGKVLHARKMLAELEDVWFLHWQELISMLEGEAGPVSRALQQRKHARRVYSACHRPPFIGPQELAQADTAALQGTGAAGGIGRGRVRKVGGKLPDLRKENEQIVIVMTALDPAGTPLLRHAAGVILERGGLLSHAAIIARELDVPLVVGLPGIMDRLAEGSLVEIDGRSGNVRVVEGE
jgi:pyruvate,water dikinase